MGERLYWLFQWIDACGIRSVDQARKHLRDTASKRAIVDLAAAQPYTTEPLPPGTTPSLVAGRGLDLSGDLDCLHWECRRRQVDHLITRVALYFDRVVIVGAPAHQVVTDFEVLDPGQFDERLLSHIQLLLYLREIGAEKLLYFRQKPPACKLHWRERTQDAGMGEIADFTDREAERLQELAEIYLKPHENHFDYQFDHPDFEHSVWGAIDAGVDAGNSRVELDRRVCAAVFQKYLVHLASDVRAANSLQSPLGCSVKYHNRLLSFLRRPSAVPDVAFALALPVLSGVPPSELLRLRSEEQDAFTRFRQALSQAITERIASQKANNGSAVASEVFRDLIEPALANIHDRLRRAQRALAKKAVISLSLGALATTCGLLSATSVLVAAGFGGVLGALNAEHKFIDEQKEVELSDLYFAWLARAHRSHGHV
jgi:hypothetical protein